MSKERLMMTWDRVRALSKNGHVFGSHSMSHPDMAYLTKDLAEHELAESKRRLERVLNTPIVHFSYPCPALTPHWTSSTAVLSQKVGYLTAVTTDGGSVRQKDDPLYLHRLRPTKEAEGLRWDLACSFLGRAR